MINIADIHDCFGCGVCAKACPKQIIALKLNKNGFYEPRIESADQCIKCSICVEVCAFAADSQVIDLKPTSYAAWSLNDDIRKNSSSGGIAFEIGRQMLQQGFKICVVRYNYAKRFRNIISHETRKSWLHLQEANICRAIQPTDLRE